MQTLLLDLSHISVDNIVADEADHSVSNSLVEVNRLHAVEDVDSVDLCENSLSSLKCELAAVVSVYLVSVVLGRVVACCYHYAGAAVQCSYCPGQHGGRHEFLVDVYLDTVGSENLCCALGEVVGLDTAVAGDSHGLLLAACENILSKTLSSLLYGVYVHSVGACADNAAESAGAELEVAVEAVVFAVLVVLNALKFLLEVGVSDCLSEPQVIELLNICHYMFLLLFFSTIR